MPKLSLSRLVTRFHECNRLLVANGQLRQATADGHRFQLAKLPRPLHARPADAFTVELLARCPATRDFLMSVQRLFNWAFKARLIAANPIGRVSVPPVGQRERTLTRSELAGLFRAASRRYRRFWAIQRHTLARPQELRSLRWRDVLEGQRVLRLVEFKAKRRRRDKLQTRYIPLDCWAVRLLAAMRRNLRPSPDQHVFPDRWGGELSCTAVRIAFQRTARRAGIDQSGERAVCYTIRHTSATEATRNGIRDRQLADIMGHTTTATTARYQHLQAADLVAVIDQATRRPGRQAG